MKTRVARHHADRTNQKLYFCRVYCQLAEQTTDKQLATAHLESAVMQLYGGYLALLQEIGSFYGLNLSEPSLANIETALASKTQVSPEVQRLRQAEVIDDIELAWQHVLYKNPTVQQTVEVGTQAHSDDALADNRLPVIDVMKGLPTVTTGLSAELVRQWRTTLMALIEALREGMAEY